jgi:hypothetical protein
MNPASQNPRRPIRALASLALAALLLALATPVATVAAAAEGADDADAPAGNAALSYWLAFATMPSSEAEVAIIENWYEAPFDDAATKLLESPGTVYALSELRRGARMGRCDWGMDYSHGPELLIPQLAKGRQLARLAMLRARHRFEQGAPRDGVVDALAGLKLGHDLGNDPIMISVFVQLGLEGMAIDLLAQHLPRLSPEELDQLAQALDRLPARDRLKDVWATESRYMVDWFDERLKRAAADAGDDWDERVLAMPIFGKEEREKLKAAGVPSPEETGAQLEAIRVYYREMEKVTDLPPVERDARVNELEKSVRPQSVLAQILLPAIHRVFNVRDRARAKHAMLRAAIATQRGGAERLKEPALADPYGKGPFEYRKTSGGFELQSKLKDDAGKPVTVTVGDPVAKS